MRPEPRPPRCGSTGGGSWAPFTGSVRPFATRAPIRPHPSARRSARSGYGTAPAATSSTSSGCPGSRADATLDLERRERAGIVDDDDAAARVLAHELLRHEDRLVLAVVGERVDHVSFGPDQPAPAVRIRL